MALLAFSTPFFQAAAAHHHAQDHHQGHEQQLDSHVLGLHGGKGLAHLGGGHPLKLAGGHFEEVEEQPSGDGGIEHHQKIVSRHAEPAVPVPLGPLGLQLLKGHGDALAAGPAHGELHGHDGQTHDEQEHDIDDHKGGAAVLPYDVGEPPYVAQADGTSGGDEHESQAGGKCFSFFHNENSFPLLQTLPHHETASRPMQQTVS